MKTIGKKFVCFCFLVALLCCTGCSKGDATNKPNKEKTPIHTVFILQPISTVPIVNIEAAQSILETVCTVPGSSMSIIVADGEPFEYASIEPDDIDQSFSSNMKEKIVEERMEELMSICKSAEAKTSETDLRTAIEMGARELHGYNDNAKKQLVILGSFINTTAPILMQDMILSNLDVESTIHNLSLNGWLVDLNNIFITAFNLGDTCSPQNELTNQDKNNLKKFWNKFFLEGKVAGIEFMEDLPSEKSYKGLPEVSTVPVVEAGSVLQKIEQNNMQDIDGVVFDESTVTFHKDTAELTNENIAREAVSTVAEYMCSSGTKALLVGTTAKSGELKEAIALSFERAQEVKRLLLEDGVPEENITVIGSGWLSKLYRPDLLDETGKLDENVAPMNRTCTWVNRDSKLAEEILNDEDYENFMVE